MGMLDDLKKMHDQMQNYMQEKELDKRISEGGPEYKMYDMSLKGFPCIYPNDLLESFRKKVTDTYNQRMEIFSEINKLERKKKKFSFLWVYECRRFYCGGRYQLYSQELLCRTCDFFQFDDAVDYIGICFFFEN